MAKQEKSAAELYREERKARLAKAAKKNVKKSHKIIWTKSKKRFVSVLVVLALILGVVGIALNVTGVLERGKTIMTVDGEKVDKYEYAYYCTMVYTNLVQSSYQYDSMYGEGYGVMFTGFDWSQQPDKQAYTGEIEGIENPTYMDYIEYSAQEQIKLIKAYVQFAEENGITLDAEELAEVQTNINNKKKEASDSGYGYANYLRSDYGYGDGMTPALYEKIVTEGFIAQKVEETKSDEFNDYYTEEVLEGIFNEDVTAYGVVTFRKYTVAAEKVTEEGSQTAAVTEETMAQAKTDAEALAEIADDTEAFLAEISAIEKANNNEKYESYLTDDTLTLVEDATYSSVLGTDTDDTFEKWLFSAERTAGETYVEEVADKGYTVYVVAEPVHKVDPGYTYDVRHILLQFPETTTEEGGEEVTATLLDTNAYEAVIDIDVDLETTKDPALYMDAQDLLVEYLEGDMTEDSFAELAKTHSADGNAADGGIYEDVTEGYMVAEFENWALEEGRQKGDVGIVETTYGYHIMYFIGTEEVSNWATEMRSALASEDLTEFSDGLTADQEITFKSKQSKDVRDFVKGVARTYINYYTSSSTYSYY